jgi:peroxiredoxin Q/BCP
MGSGPARLKPRPFHSLFLKQALCTCLRRDTAMMKRLGWVGLVTLLGVFLVSAVLGASLPSVGSTAPDFTLNSQDGNPVTLSQFRGKWVVLYFYPRDMTSGCTLEAHNFQRDQEKFKAANAVVLGVSVDDTKSHQQFCTKEGLTFKLLSDTNHKVSEEYGSLTNLGLIKFSKRHTFIIDPEGKIVKEYPDVDSNINQHSQQVLAELAQLQKKG